MERRHEGVQEDRKKGQEDTKEGQKYTRGQRDREEGRRTRGRTERHPWKEDTKKGQKDMHIRGRRIGIAGGHEGGLEDKSGQENINGGGGRKTRGSAGVKVGEG